MQAVVLAAGKGERLLPLTRSTPKSLLPITNGITLLESQMLSIQKVPEIVEILYVVGYLAEQIEAKLQFFARDGLSVKTIYNPFYEVSNNLISLWLAMAQCGENFVVINGDDMFNPSILEGLVNSPPDHEIVMVIDRKKNYDDDDMKVRTEGARAYEVSKEIAPEKANAESIGMILFRSNGARKLKSVLDQMVRIEEGKKNFWLNAVQKIMDEGIPVYYHECSRDDWAEVDFHLDLETVQNKIKNEAEILRIWINSIE